jgi:uncharacterized membrane-anchored protein YjiN (DUF445 family)
MIWLEADARLREKSGGRKSLDDFAAAFFGVDNGSWAVKTYTFDDVVTALNGVVADDWATFLRTRLDGTAADVAVFVVERYGAELTAVITHTIERWDGREAARRIELHVGRDLQFIRINGTIVGGLVGVLIHTVAILVG